MFCSAPSLVFNAVVDHLCFSDFQRLHAALTQGNRAACAQWDKNLRQYAHHASALFGYLLDRSHYLWAIKVGVDVQQSQLLTRVPTAGLVTPAVKDYSYEFFAVEQGQLRACYYSSHQQSFFQACRRGDCALVRAMLQHCRAGAVDTECTGYEGYRPGGIQPMDAAIRGGHTAIVACLLEFGTSVNDRSGSKSSAAEDDSHLHIAVKYARLEAAKLLIQAGADLNWRCAFQNGDTALHLAVDEGNLLMVRLLVDSGCNVHIRNDEGWTALDLAMECEQRGIRDLLLSAGGAATADGGGNY